MRTVRDISPGELSRVELHILTDMLSVAVTCSFLSQLELKITRVDSKNG